MIILAIAAFVLTLVLVVGLHEAGHALAAGFCGINIKRISIGFGKPIISWQGRSGCEWVWATWPLGGYVQLQDSRYHSTNQTTLSRSFDKQSVGVRCFVLSAGVIANLLFAWFALTIYFMAGYQQRLPIISEVLPNSIADKVDIKPGDKFTQFAGVSIHSWQEVGTSFILHLGEKQISVTVIQPDGMLKTSDLDLQGAISAKNRTLFSFLGITPDKTDDSKEVVAGVSLFKASQQAFVACKDVAEFFFHMLSRLLQGLIPFSLLLGPLGILSLSVHSLAEGLVVFLFYIAQLSLTVGLVNILPIPGLDGGAIVIACIEKIRGKPISVALETLLYRLAKIAFYILIVQLVMNDLLR